MLQCCQYQYSIKDMHTFQFEYNTHCGFSIHSWEIFFPQHQMSSLCHTLVVAKQPAHSVFADTAEHHHVTYYLSYGNPAAAVIWVECCSFSLATFSFFKYEFFEYNLFPQHALVMSPLFQFNNPVSWQWAPRSPLAATDKIIKRMWLCSSVKSRDQKGGKRVRNTVKRNGEQMESWDGLWMRESFHWQMIKIFDLSWYVIQKNPNPVASTVYCWSL